MPSKRPGRRVDDDGELLAVRPGQNAVEMRGFAGTQISGQYRDGGGFDLRHGGPPERSA